MKFLLSSLAFILILLFLRTLLTSRTQHRPDTRTPPPKPNPKKIVPCATCQIHIPIQETITDHQQNHFCCLQHRDQWQHRKQP